MSTDGAETGLVETKEALEARMACLSGVSPLEDMSHIISGLPPTDVAACHPEALKVGAEIPDLNGSLITTATAGIYSAFGQIVEAAIESYYEAHPTARYAPDPNASITGKFENSASNSIASLFTAEPETPGLS